ERLQPLGHLVRRGGGHPGRHRHRRAQRRDRAHRDPPAGAPDGDRRDRRRPGERRPMSGTPTWEQFNVPVLTVLSDGMTRSLRQLRRDVADAVGLTAEQRAETLPSGQLRADNRIGWAASFLNRVDALDHPSRGQYVITDFGRELLERHPTGITENDLKAVAKEGDEWWLSRSAANGQEDQPLDTSATDLD